MYFYFLNQGQFFLLVTFCFPPLSYCQQNQQNFALECLLISGQESACTVPGRVKFLHCSWTRGFFGRLFRASEKTENRKLLWRALRTSRGLEATELLAQSSLTLLVTRGQLPNHATWKTLWFLVNQRLLHVPESDPSQLSWPYSFTQQKRFCLAVLTYCMLSGSPRQSNSKVFAVTRAPLKGMLQWNYLHKCSRMYSHQHML